MFKREGEIRLQDDPRVIKSGMQKNIRVVGNDPNFARAILQVDGKIKINCFKLFFSF